MTASRDTIDTAPADETYRITDNPMHYFSSIQRQNQANMGRMLMAVGLNPHMWRILALLSDGVGRTIGDIADIVVIDRSNLGRLLEGMAQEDLVTRVAAEADRRLSLTAITAAGRRKFAIALPLVRALYEQLMFDVSPEEFAALMTTLRKLKRNALGARGS